MRTERAAGGHDLNADDDIAIGFDRLLDLGFIDQPGIGENAVSRPANAAERGKIDVVQHARLGIVGHVIAKYVEQRVTRAAGVDDGRDSGADAENIGIDAEGAEPFHQM